jgi:hypothetical protein
MAKPRSALGLAEDADCACTLLAEKAPSAAIKNDRLSAKLGFKAKRCINLERANEGMNLAIHQQYGRGSDLDSEIEPIKRSFCIQSCASKLLRAAYSHTQSSQKED